MVPRFLTGTEKERTSPGMARFGSLAVTGPLTRSISAGCTVSASSAAAVLFVSLVSAIDVVAVHTGEDLVSAGRGAGRHRRIEGEGAAGARGEVELGVGEAAERDVAGVHRPVEREEELHVHRAASRRVAEVLHLRRDEPFRAGQHRRAEGVD